MKTKLFLLLALVSFGFGCSGADSSGNGTYKPPTTADVQKESAAIDANPNMPPQAKAMQKAMLEKNGTGQKSQGGK